MAAGSEAWGQSYEAENLKREESVENQRPKVPLDIKVLKEAGEFTIIFDNDKGMKCQLIEGDNYNLVVSWNDKKVLVPKHSVKYVLL